MTETIPTRSNLTPTESRIMALLIDGRCHPMKELIACLPDPEMGSDQSVRDHLTNLRKKLVGHDVYYRMRNGSEGKKVPHYQLVRLVGNYDE